MAELTKPKRTNLANIKDSAKATIRPKKEAKPSDEALPNARSGTSIQSLERAFFILETVASERDGIGLAELSQRVGLHTSTAFHLIKTMTALGYVRQISDTKKYRIGRPIFALAAGALDEVEMVSLAMPILEELTSQVGESCHFAVRMGSNVTIIARTQGAGAFQLTERAGVVRPAYCTALGKVILSALSPRELDQYIEQTPLAAFTPKTISDAVGLRAEIKKIQATGIAHDDGEFDPELRCVAMPVFDFTQQLIGAIGISGPVWRSSQQSIQQRITAMGKAAKKLSREFGAKI